MNTKQLRQKILDLAIHGKLVPQDPNDEPASVLLERIHAEKERLIKEGKIKRNKKDSAALHNDDKSHYGQLPFDLPDSWVWVKLGEICEVSTGPFGTMLHKSDYVQNGIPLINPQNITDNGIAASKFISTKTAERLKTYQLHEDDVIIGRRGEMGRCAAVLASQDGWLCGTGCFIIKNNPAFFGHFLSMLIGSKYSRSYLEKNSIGATMSNLNHGILKFLLLPLPPLAEQHRIVAAIESAFTVIDEIERNKKDLQAAVNTAKSKILSLAIRGKLVPQDPNDEPASVLLERIRAEREALEKAGKVKRGKSSPAIIRSDDNCYYQNYKNKMLLIEDELAEDVPAFWEVCCLSQLSFNHTSKPHQILQSEILEEGNYPVISQSAKFIEGYSNDKSRLFTITNPIIVFGDHTRCVKYIDFNFVVGADGTKLIEPYSAGVFPKFFYYLVLFSSERMASKGYSRHFQYLEKLVMLLPPLAEQRRIVVAIETAFEQLDSITAILA